MPQIKKKTTTSGPPFADFSCISDIISDMYLLLKLTNQLL